MSYGPDTERLVLEKVRELLIPALAPWVEPGSILDYRAWPSERGRTVMLSIHALQPLPPTTGDDRRVWIEVGITITSSYQTSGAGLEQAERDMGKMSAAIFGALINSRNELWHRVVIDAPWERPPTQDGWPASVRIGYCNVRLIMK